MSKCQLLPPVAVHVFRDLLFRFFGGVMRGSQIRPEATISEERVLYDIDGKFAYTVYDPQKANRAQRK